MELAIPHVYQGLGTPYCGPASLCAILRYYGHKRVTKALLIRKTGCTSAGTEIAGILAGARIYGVEPWVWQNITYRMLREISELGHPCIALIQAWGESPSPEYAEEWRDGHYVVVTEATADEVICMDPSQSSARSSVLVQDWMERWHDLDEGRKLSNAVIVFPTGNIRRRRVGRVLPIG